MILDDMDWYSQLLFVLFIYYCRCREYHTVMQVHTSIDGNIHMYRCVDTSFTQLLYGHTCCCLWFEHMCIKDNAHDFHAQITIYFGLSLPVIVRSLEGKHVFSCIFYQTKGWFTLTQVETANAPANRIQKTTPPRQLEKLFFNKNKTFQV